MDQTPKCRAKTIKSLEENIGKRVHNLGFLDMALNLEATKGKKLDFINIKNFVHQRTLTKNEKIIHRMGKNICKSRI